MLLAADVLADGGDRANHHDAVALESVASWLGDRVRERYREGRIATPKRRLTIYVSPETGTALAVAAAQRGMTLSDLACEAFEAYLARHGG